MNLFCLHRWAVVGVGESIISGQGEWGGGKSGLARVCRKCGRMIDNETGEQLTSPAALAAGAISIDPKWMFGFVRCWRSGHDWETSSAIFPTVSHWRECRRCGEYERR